MKQHKSLFEKTNRDLDLLAPFFRETVIDCLSETNKLGFNLRIFEGYRTATRQAALFQQGRATPGKIITNAPAWMSWHQYGLAIDIAYQVKGKWSWDGDFDTPAKVFIKHGLQWLSPYEKVHFQLTGKIPIEEARIITRDHGLQALWLVMKQNLFQ